MTSATRDFLDLSDFDALTLRAILSQAREMKARSDNRDALPDKTLAMIFEKKSTRTRVSFEVGMLELGGHALYLDKNDLQLGRGESVADTARVLSRYVDCIMLRTNSHDTLLEMAAHAEVPVINGLTDKSHPCQILADILTYEEHRDTIEGKTVAWVGDVNNVLTSWIHAAPLFGFTLRISCPEGSGPQSVPDGVEVIHSPQAAVDNADAVVTDTWRSMGDGDAEAKIARLQPYQVNEALMQCARHDAVFLHCLPATRGQEVSAGVIDGPHSVVFDEAENRLHVQKAVLVHCMGDK